MVTGDSLSHQNDFTFHLKKKISVNIDSST